MSDNKHMHNSAPNPKKSEHYHNLSTSTEIKNQIHLSKHTHTKSTKTVNPNFNQTNI